ncbi:hypothetical protein BOTBODRAFT_247663 [Botryobasidium botryosum FD-172 SS1]|uniref:Uncharacterized protein n=1 Tax=Botryobasidium botryosum (strain FD-172 SS1) TaxID=930990 RepID=A0A067M3R2_BOTB1|nr:hypothetical protein BOTBODRAFT_247663 [Botryobasidium botryosum FD-172 SS1]
MVEEFALKHAPRCLGPLLPTFSHRRWRIEIAVTYFLPCSAIVHGPPESLHAPRCLMILGLCQSRNQLIRTLIYEQNGAPWAQNPSLAPPPSQHPHRQAFARTTTCMALSTGFPGHALDSDWPVMSA